MSEEQTLRSRRATIKDVAARADVSISTVSHVYSGARSISAKTRERVERAAAELDYRPDAVAQSLRTAQTGIIGFALRPRDAVAGSLRGTQTFERLIGATAAHVLESGRALILVPDLLDPDARQVPMDGCIVANPYGSDKVLTHLTDRGFPMVSVDPDPERPELVWSVNIDYRTSMIALLDQMRCQGAHRIMLVSGTEDNAWNRDTSAAYLEWSTTHQMIARHEQLYEGEGVHGATGVVREALGSDHPPDGVITAASTFAAGALQAVQQANLRVPQDVLLAALTDSEYTRNSTPTVTSIDLNLEEAAKQAVALLINRLEGGEAPTAPHQIQPRVHWRESTGITSPR